MTPATRDHGHAETTFIVVPFSPRTRMPPSGQEKVSRTVVAGEHQDGVVGNAGVVQLLHDRADCAIQFAIASA